MENELKQVEIISASIKDMMCNYGYELQNSQNKGDKVPNHKGAHVIHEDLQDAFSNLAVFLAHIDGAFNNWADNQTPIDELEDSAEFTPYIITGFRLFGSEENRSVALSGYKETLHGTISFDTPRIKLEGSYLYLAELKERLDKAIEEVELYMNGKQAPHYEQSEMDFDELGEDDFENAKIED